MRTRFEAFGIVFEVPDDTSLRVLLNGSGDQLLQLRKQVRWEELRDQQGLNASHEPLFSHMTGLRYPNLGPLNYESNGRSRRWVYPTDGQRPYQQTYRSFMWEPADHDGQGARGAGKVPYYRIQPHDLLPASQLTPAQLVRYILMHRPEVFGLLVLTAMIEALQQMWNEQL